MFSNFFLEKNGVAPEEVVDLTKYILNECKNLHLEGLMTIGRFGYNREDGPNPDFLCLKSCRDEICQNLGLDWKEVHLSMGMSDDFEHAVILHKMFFVSFYQFFSRLNWVAPM